MILGITNGRNDTSTSTGIANAFLNVPIIKDAIMLVSVPTMLARLGIFRTGTVWEIRRAVYGRSEELYMG
eukprot:12924115-Prorocentrum_lima.AAC.1